jgi:hypothetical protein
MLVPALLGGLFVGVLSALPIVNVANCCCLWIFTGGILAAYVLQQNESEPIGSARGAGVGLMAGVIGAGMWLVVSLLLEPIVGPLQERMMASARNAGDMPPDMRAWFDMFASRGSLAARLSLGFLVQLVAGLVFSTLGGLVGSAITRPPAGNQAVPPPLPPL